MMKSNSPDSPRAPEAASFSRRHFLADAGKTTAASVLAGISIPAVHAAGSDGIRLALIGCGGRGSGAVVNAMDADDGVSLTAMADLYEDRLENSRVAIEGKYKERATVSPENRFIGFDAFKRAIDTLRPDSGDVAMLTGYAGFRPQHLRRILRGFAVSSRPPRKPRRGA
jgi:hypothetical protein